MKTVILGAAIVIAIVAAAVCRKPTATAPFNDFQHAQHLQMQLDSMQFELTMEQYK